MLREGGARWPYLSPKTRSPGQFEFHPNMERILFWHKVVSVRCPAFYPASLLWAGGDWALAEGWRGAAEQEEAHRSGRTLYSSGGLGVPGHSHTAQVAPRRCVGVQAEPPRCSACSLRSRLRSSSSQCCASSCACGGRGEEGRCRQGPHPSDSVSAWLPPPLNPARPPPCLPPRSRAHPRLGARAPRRRHLQRGGLLAALGRLLLEPALQLLHALVLGGHLLDRRFLLFPPARDRRA